jgi:hypothetical protein
MKKKMALAARVMSACSVTAAQADTDDLFIHEGV